MGRGPAPAGPGRIAGPFHAGRRDRVVCCKLLVHSASPLMRQVRGCALGLFWYLLTGAGGAMRLVVVMALG
jgi:hypothetical protein